MVITNFGKNRTALLLGGSITSIPSYFAIGSGSGIATASDTTLIREESRQVFTSTAYPTSTKVLTQADWNSVEMSGLQVSEWAILESGAALTGSIWSRTSFPTVNFDGTIELQIQETWEVY